MYVGKYVNTHRREERTWRDSLFNCQCDAAGWPLLLKDISKRNLTDSS